MTQGIFRIIFPKSKILNKIRNFVNPGNDSGEFPEIFPGIFYYNFFQIFQILFLTKAEKPFREFEISFIEIFQTGLYVRVEMPKNELLTRK